MNEPSNEKLAATLVVELIIIGVTTLLWMLLLGVRLGAFTVEQLGAFFRENPIAWLPLGALIYVLGVIMDRICDFLFYPFEWLARRKAARKVLGWEMKSGDIRQQNWSHLKAFTLQNRELHEELQYQRHRIRIARAGAISFLIAAAISYCFPGNSASNALFLPVTAGGLAILACLAHSMLVRATSRLICSQYLVHHTAESDGS